VTIAQKAIGTANAATTSGNLASGITIVPPVLGDVPQRPYGVSKPKVSLRPPQ
jgi:hypothetical protein